MQWNRSLALLAVLLIGPVGAAHAGDAGKFNEIDADGDGTISLEEAREAESDMLAEEFEQYDADDNDRLDQGEFARFEGTQLLNFDEYDVNNDGEISAAEAEEYGPESLSGNLEDYDRDEDESLDEGEFAQFEEDQTGMTEESPKFEEYDTNGDGVVSLEEAEEAGPHMLSENFGQYDTDEDENLDEGEFAQFEADLRAQEEGGMQKRQGGGM
ncbi:EF-hand domain-containing protein [Thiohalorhabdus sp. Cl-TMA]|uniref:EF-hand domain-containing protein n=1 Tax=Thiohalorhabdus methylotrophus TaxID=3242694 RepID=A0ABV4TSA7_9GAMM